MSHPLHIVVVEDHAPLCDLMVETLQATGHVVHGLASSVDLDEYLLQHAIDILLLDINLPGEDGYSVAARLRRAHPGLYIIMLTARSSVGDKIKGYASGADLYLAKPVTTEELLAAIQAIARRITAPVRQPATQLDMARLQLQQGERVVDLSRAEALLLKSLAEAPDRQLPYWRLLEILGLEPDPKAQGVLEVRISRLKKKVAQSGIADPLVKSLRGEGYRLCLALEING